MIQWYPGHMAKTKRMLEENLRLIDVVVEMIDARVPYSTMNPDFDSLFSGKSRLLLLNKEDLADRETVTKWLEYFRSNGYIAESVSSIEFKSRSAIQNIISKASEPIVDKMKRRGVLKTVRVLVAGIPNVGKSTFINHFAGKNRAKVGNKPGVTKGKQWITINRYLELMDSPGLLWPKLENDLCSKHLAYIGSISDLVIDIEELSASLISELLQIRPNDLTARFPTLQEKDIPVLEAVCRDRNYTLLNHEFDTLRAAHTVLDEFRKGKLCRFCLEFPDRIELYHEKNQ